MYNDVFLGKNREQEKDGPEVGIRIQEGRDGYRDICILMADLRHRMADTYTTL